MGLFTTLLLAVKLVEYNQLLNFARKACDDHGFYRKVSKCCCENGYAEYSELKRKAALGTLVTVYYVKDCETVIT